MVFITVDQCFRFQDFLLSLSVSLSLSLSTARAPAGYRLLFFLSPALLLSKEANVEKRANNNSLFRSLILHNDFLMVTRGARNPNLQGVITHVLHLCSQDSFGFPLRMNGMLKMQFDHMCFNLLPLVICSHAFWPSVKENLCKAQHWSKSIWTSDRCCPLPLTFGNH